MVIDEYTLLRQRGYFGTLEQMRVQAGTNPDYTGNDTVGEQVYKSRTPADVLALLGIGATESPEKYGAVGDGVANDEAAVRAAVAAANAKARVGVVGTIFHPGATLFLSGVYNMPNLASPINIMSNVISNATIVAPTAYAGTVLIVGHGASGSILQDAEISLPDVVKVGASYPLTVGSIGVLVQNLYSSKVFFGRVAYFETGERFGGLGEGVCYNEIHMGWVSYSKTSIALKPQAGGWVNQNTFVGGGVQQSTGFMGGQRLSGVTHLLIDGTGIFDVNGNTFVGCSWEGNASLNVFDLRYAQQNTFIGNRFEQGVVGTPCVFTGGGSATITKAAHGLAVNDVIIFQATVVPTNCVLSSPWFVIATPTADTFTVAQKKGGAAQVFASAGTTVTFLRPMRIVIDGVSYAYGKNNPIINPYTAFGILDIVETANTGGGNAMNNARNFTMDTDVIDDTPMIRVRDRNFGAVSPSIAAYPPAVHPFESPKGWNTALSYRGLLFGAADAEILRLGQTSGSLRTRKSGDSIDYEVFQGLRSQGGPVSITSLSCTASTTTTTTLTLTGAATGDHAIVTFSADLPAGLVLAWARVSAANTIKVGFYNYTAGAIVLTTTAAIAVIRQYF